MIAKISLIMEDYQGDIVLSGNVDIDETYYSLIHSKPKEINGKKLKRISNNKYYIATACDNHQLFGK